MSDRYALVRKKREEDGYINIVVSVPLREPTGVWTPWTVVFGVSP